MSGLIALTDFSEMELMSLLDLADHLRDLWTSKKMPQNLKGKNVALIWEAGGFRNRVAFELGIAAMGGRAVHVSPLPAKLVPRDCRKN